jgi:hypothetical protein
VNVVRTGSCLVAIMLLVPTVLAAAELSAPKLSILGVSALRGDGAVVFAPSISGAFLWSLHAASGELVSTSVDTVNVRNPLVTDTELVSEGPLPQETRVTLTDVTMMSGDLIPGGALLAMGDEATNVEARSIGFAELGSTTDPAVRQYDSEVANAQDFSIRESLTGNFVHANLSDVTIFLTGDLTLILYGPSYTLTSKGETTQQQTGHHVETDGVAAWKGHDEIQSITLKDATLELRAPAGAEVFTRTLHVAMDGGISATGAQGGLTLGDADALAAPDGAFRWTGETSFDLAPMNGALVARTPAPIATASGTLVPTTSRLPILAASGLAILLLFSALALGLHLRRARKNDLDIALLAMEERRWEDAIPRLARLAKKDPTNAAVQIDRALCLEQVGRFADASRAFEAALRATPKNAEAHFYYARTLAKMRESEAARVHLETALERDPRLVEMVRAEAVLRGL